jgi:hypothetical protein
MPRELVERLGRLTCATGFHHCRRPLGLELLQLSLTRKTIPLRRLPNRHEATVGQLVGREDRHQKCATWVIGMAARAVFLLGRSRHNDFRLGSLIARATVRRLAMIRSRLT